VCVCVCVLSRHETDRETDWWIAALLITAHL